MTTTATPYAAPTTGGPPATQVVHGTEIQTTISPIDQSKVLTRPLLSKDQLDVLIGDAVKAQKSWKKVSLAERKAICEKWMVSQAPAPQDITNAIN